MKIPITRVLFLVLVSTLIIAGCDMFGDRTELSPRVMADLQELRAMIPAIEAGLMVATPVEETAGASSFRTMTYSSPTAQAPDLYYSDAAAVPDANGVVRYPYAANTYLDDFYGTVGNQAYLTLTPHATNAALYVVDLYIYPTLSTVVDYVHEQYLVVGSSASWALVDGTGAAAPLNYLVNETVHFDGTVQVNDVQWTRYSDGAEKYYPIPADGSRVPNDFSDAAYTYPSDPAGFEPAKADAGTGQYSAKVVSTIADRGLTVVEYYTDSDPEEDGLFEVFAVSYVERTDSSQELTVLEKTVRRYYQNDASGVKKIRSRTEADVDYAGLFASSSVVTEAADISVNAAGAIIFESTINASDADTGDYLYSIRITLTESGPGTNQFVGTMISDAGAAGTETYSLALSGATGLEVSGTGNISTDGTFSGMNRKVFSDFVVELAQGGEFKGKIKKGVINGLYKRLGDEVDVYVSLTAVLGISGSQVSVR